MQKWGCKNLGLVKPGFLKLGLHISNILNTNVSKLLNHMQYDLTKIEQDDQ